MIQRRNIHGATVIYERVEKSPVFAFSICVRCGSRDERYGEYGLTHFFEHMVFKGTKNRNYEEISSEIESVGGELDAYTTRDNLCFTCKVPFIHYKKAIEIVFDIILNPLFKEKDIDLEKNVVLEELRMSNENHDDSGDELFMSLLYPEDELGRSILGNEKSIPSFTKEQLVNYRNTRITTENLIVSIAGDIKEDLIFREVENYIKLLEVKGCEPSKNRQSFRVFEKKVKREGMDGVNLYIAFETFPPEHRNRFAISILNSILGYGMSSRLFIKVREKLGLAYSISSFPVYYRNEGMFYIFASTSKGKEDKLKKVILDECLNFSATIEKREFEKGKNQLLGSLSLGLETMLSRALFNAKNISIYKELLDFSDVVSLIESIDFLEVKTLAEKIFKDEKAAVLLYGNV